MRNFYILSKDQYAPHAVSHFSESHYIDLPDGRVLVCGEFRAEHFEKRWTSQPNVVAFPHPLSGKKISVEHVKALQALDSSIDASHSTYDVAEKLRKIHPLFKF